MPQRKIYGICENKCREEVVSRDEFDVTRDTLASDILVERNRIDTFTKMQEGSTTGDAELVDIRIGYDNTKYDSAGDAVRGQCRTLENTLTMRTSNNEYELELQKDLHFKVESFFYDKKMETHPIASAEIARIPVLPGEIYYLTSYTNYMMCPYIVVDKDDKPLKFKQFDGAVPFDNEKIEISQKGATLILQIQPPVPFVTLMKAVGAKLKKNTVRNENIKNGVVTIDKLTQPVSNFFKNCKFDVEVINPNFTYGEYLHYAEQGKPLEKFSIADQSYGWVYLPVNEGETYKIVGSRSYDAFCYALTTKDKFATRCDNNPNNIEKPVTEEITVQSGEYFLYLSAKGFKSLSKVISYKPNVDEQDIAILNDIRGLLKYKQLCYETLDFSPNDKKYAAFVNGQKIKIMTTQDSNYSYVKVPVTVGDRFVISGQHGWGSSCWILTDKNDVCVRNDGLSDSGASSLEAAVIDVQENESFLYINKYGFKYLRKYVGYTNEYQRLNSKKIIYDGDSICESRGATTGKSDNGGGYPKLIADKTNSIYVNQAVGGATLITLQGVETVATHSVVDNIVNLPTDGDLYCFEGGINDYWQNADLGTFSKTDYTTVLDTKTVCGALEYIFRYALEHFAGKPICFIIVHKIQLTAYTANKKGNTFEEYHDKFVGICEKYSIPYYDAFKESGLNGWNTTQNNMFFQKEVEGQQKGDGCHPNKKGYEVYYVPKLIQMFEGLIE